jgi:hypothetical protein
MHLSSPSRRTIAWFLYIAESLTVSSHILALCDQTVAGDVATRERLTLHTHGRITVLRSGLAGCSGNARIGSGTASAEVPVGTQTVHEKASLNAFMGPPVTDEIHVLWYIEAAELVLPSSVKDAEAPFGQELVTEVPLVQVWLEGPDLALETFDSSIGPTGLVYHRPVNGKMMAYHPTGIRIPRACPASGYRSVHCLTSRTDRRRGQT